VDAPLDDANVGRYVRLLAEFKDLTQFIVITHNPRTMQGRRRRVRRHMQEPGSPTIVRVATRSAWSRPEWNSHGRHRDGRAVGHPHVGMPLGESR